MECGSSLNLINNCILGSDMLDNIKFCLLMTISKILSAIVASFVVLSIPMLIAMVSLGREYHGFSYWQLIAPCLLCIISIPFCAKWSICCFKGACDIAETTIVSEQKVSKK